MRVEAGGGHHNTIYGDSGGFTLVFVFLGACPPYPVADERPRMPKELVASDEDVCGLCSTEASSKERCHKFCNENYIVTLNSL